MSNANIDLGDIHWLMDILQNIDVGLVVLDHNYNIQLWNGFMESHSGISPQKAKDQNLFELCPEIPGDWFKQKSEAVFQLKTRTFTIWEQRPYLFKFKNYRPITGRADNMYQNTSIIPLESVDKQVDHICIIVYDVTDVAMNRQDAENAGRSLSELSQTDHLTELNNRMIWEQDVKREFTRCRRSGTASSIAILDVDNLRSINAGFGHNIGDQVLRVVAESLRQTTRQTDFLCRFGGDLFAVLLIDSDESSATEFAERMRHNIAQLEVATDNQPIQVTSSIGLAQINNRFDSHLSWMLAANKALLHAKQQGGNQTTLYHPKMSEF